MIEKDPGRFSKLSRDERATLPPGHTAELSTKSTRELMREETERRVAPADDPSPSEDLVSVCRDIHDRWDRDMRSGKLLIALMGGVDNYDPRVTRIRRALNEQSDNAAIGAAFMGAWEANREHPALMGWTPAECPSEMVGDLLEEIDTLRDRAKKAEQAREDLLEALRPLVKLLDDEDLASIADGDIVHMYVMGGDEIGDIAFAHLSNVVRTYREVMDNQ